MNTIQQRKGKAEDKDPEVLLPEKLLLKSSVPKRRERIRLAKKIDLRFGATRRELVVVTQNAPFGIPAQKTLQDEEPPIGKGLSLRPLPSGRSFHIFLNEKMKEKGLQQKGLQLLCE